MQKIGAIIQSRMSSERFPGKVLKTVKNKPLLQYIIERLACCQTICDSIVATSWEKSDDPIEDFCLNNCVPFYRGSLANVASRFKEISENRRWDAFVRINGDSPLIDPEIVDKCVTKYQKGDFDIVTNTFPRSYPPGQSIEVVRCSMFIRTFQKMTKTEDYEHVTRYFYQHPKQFRIYNFLSDRDLSRIHLAVDTPDDFRFVSSIITRMKEPHWKYHLDDIINLIGEV